MLREHWGAEEVDIVEAALGAVHPRHRIVRIDGVEAFLRVDPGWEGPYPPQHTAGLVNHLSQRGAPVPRVLALSAGSLTLTWQDYTISLETVLPGSSPDFGRLDVLPAAGESLGNVHCAAADFEEPQSFRPVGDCVRPLLRLAARRESVESRSPFENLIERIEECFSNTLAMDIPWLFCHGDVGCGNTLVDASGAVAYTDFGRAAYMPALVDVLMPRFQWLMGDSDCGRGFLDASESAAFLTGYERARPLSTHERAAIPVIWAAYYAEYLSFLRVKWGETRDRMPKRRFEISRRIEDLPGETLEMGEGLIRELAAPDR